MQPFRITCETCRSRLKIRTPEVIGEIHACPKCGSMVQIVPPAGWDLNAGGNADQLNGTGEAAISISTTASVVFPASALDDLGAVTDALEAPTVEAPAEIAPSSVLPPAEAASPVVWWAVGGVASVFLLSGLAWAVWPSSGEKVVPAPAPAVAKQDSHPSTEPSSESKAVTPVAEQAEAKPAPSQTVQAATDQTVKPAKVEPEPTAVKPTEAMPPAPAPVEAKAESAKPVDPPKAAVVKAEPAKGPSSPPTAAAVASAPDHSPVLKFDPLDFDPDRLSANAKVSTDSAASTNSIPDKAAVDPAGSGVVANNEVAGAGDVLPPAKQPVANEVLPRVANSSVTVRRGPPGDVPQHTAAQVLVARVKSFQVADMPLVRFIETMSGVAGTGITLDPLALEQVGISPQATVTVNAQDAPLQSILHDALGQRRLDIAEQGGQLRVVLPKGDAPHAIDYDVKDLVAGTDAATVGKLIEHFVAPATWKSAGGKGTLQANGTKLHIEQSDAVRRQVVIFCERLRLARGLAIQSKYPAALLSVQSPYQHLSAKLGEHTTFTFLPWTRLADVVRNCQEMSGVMVLADWGALAEAQLGPSSPVACSANDRSWQESLDGVLEPLGLGWWAVNGETIQITSLAALERIQRIEFYQVSPKLRATFASNQAIVDSLQKELSDTAGKQGKPVDAHMEVDEPSGRLIVLAAPMAQRHLSRRLASDAKQ